MDTLLLSLSFKTLLMIMASAFGCGLLIGLERERSNNRKDEQCFAGLRSFTICALLGALCFLIHIAVGVVGALVISAFSMYGLIQQSKDIGSTTELAFLMTYFIGALCVFNIPLAAGLSVLLTVILMAKHLLHDFAGNWIKDYELRDGLFLLALILIALPLMPNESLWGDALNPYVILKLLILILVVQSLAHIAKRLLPSDKALILSAIASGFVSSTATIASIGMQVRSGQADAKSSAGAALMSCVATLLLLLIIVVGVNLEWFQILLLPCLVGICILVVVALLLIYRGKKDIPIEKTQNIKHVNDSRMFSIKEAVIIAVTLTIIQIVVHGLNLLLGDNGLIIGTL